MLAGTIALKHQTSLVVSFNRIG